MGDKYKWKQSPRNDSENKFKINEIPLSIKKSYLLDSGDWKLDFYPIISFVQNGNAKAIKSSKNLNNILY